ncbi:MAG: hypothetical protein CM15mP62_21810 [Rhodospirillaceae bacterium]|nr:MAG: hypothetical protein CM15mP62_21810 [Rhodospirillaceae bacterium]
MSKSDLNPFLGWMDKVLHLLSFFQPVFIRARHGGIKLGLLLGRINLGPNFGIMHRPRAIAMRSAFCFWRFSSAWSGARKPTAMVFFFTFFCLSAKRVLIPIPNRPGTYYRRPPKPPPEQSIPFSPFFLSRTESLTFHRSPTCIIFNRQSNK